MKYDVTYSCGHEGRVDLVGKTSDRERKLWWYSNHAICPCCYKAKMNGYASVDCEEVEMKYAEYKTNFADCDTKKGTYNAKDKTIIVYVPKTQMR